MLKTKILERFRTSGQDNPENGIVLTDEDYFVIMNMGPMSLLYNPRTTLMVDVYNNKLENFDLISEPVEIIVTAKNDDYAKKFDLHGEYYVIGYAQSNGINRLKIMQGTEIKDIFPSRLKVVSASVKD